MTGARILIVDDEPAILRVLRTNLTRRGYQISAVSTGEEALQQVAEASFDLIILDLMLPGMSGIDTCQQLRRDFTTPILVLSARGEERAKVRALDLGADDYVTKPFGMDELLARVRALLRRPAQQPGVDEIGGILQAGAIRVDLGARQAQIDDRSLELTAREFDILAYLMRNAGRVTTHRMLLAEIWGPEYSGETQYLRVFINRLRRKIEEDPGRPRLILTEPGVGYRFVSSEPDRSSLL